MDDLDTRDELRTSVSDVERRLLDYEQSSASMVFRPEPLAELTGVIAQLRSTLSTAERSASASLCHAVEALIVARMSLSQTLSREIIDTILGALDAIADGLHEPKEPRQRIESVGFRIAAQIQAMKPPISPSHSQATGDLGPKASLDAQDSTTARGSFARAVDPHAHGISPKIPVTDSVSIRLAKLPTDSRSRRILIVEDEFISRQLLLALLGKFGDCDVAIDGREAVSAVIDALRERLPYSLICLDIMMPDMDGHKALQTIRAAEHNAGLGPYDRSKIVMTTALSDYENFHRAFEGSCDSYIVKPISKSVLLRQLRRLSIEPLI